MNVGVGIFTHVAEPIHVRSSSQKCCCHASVGVKVVLIPPAIAVVENDIDFNITIQGSDERVDEMSVMELIHVDIETCGGSFHPCEQVNQAVFRSDKWCHCTRALQAVTLAEGASAQTTPTVVPIGNGIGIGSVSTSAASKVDDVVQVGDGFDQGNTIPSIDRDQAVTVNEGVNLSSGWIQ